MKIDFSTYVSFTSVDKKLELLNAEEYKSVHKQMYQNYMNQYPDDTEAVSYTHLDVYKRQPIGLPTLVSVGKCSVPYFNPSP